ncbi:MAG TPA: RlpA-like double-psi beta-barrel domain-containing protein [Streptosporangiaceae bacterium]
MHRRATTAILMTATGTALAGALVTTAVLIEDGSGAGNAAALSVAAASPHLSPQRADRSARTRDKKDTRVVAEASKKKESRQPAKRPAKRKAEKKAKSLPGGVSTATSFWDPQTASGKPMSYHTVASPYWPLGTEVKVTYHGRSATGVVEDFGPAEWAVAQHDPPAIIDLSEKMMADLTGSRENSVPVRFQVLKFGHGPRYVSSGTGYDLAWGK